MEEPYKQSYKKSVSDHVNMAVYNCGLQKCTPLYTWGPGVRDHYLLHYIESGKGQFVLEGNVYPLKAGQAFFAKPGERISYTADEKEPWEYYWVGFNGTGVSSFLPRLPFTETTPYITCREPEALRQALYDVYLTRGPDAYHDARMVGQLYLVLAQLIKEAKMDEDETADTGSHYVRRAMQFIQFNYADDIGIDDIAKAVGISRSHLYRMFIQHTGISPVEYLMRFRVNEACYLLKDQRLTVGEVAASVGFSDQFYFSRVFKKLKGIPPSRFLRTQATADLVNAESPATSGVLA